MISFLRLGLTMCTQACLDLGTQMTTVYVFLLFYGQCHHKHQGKMPRVLPKRREAWARFS